jgi:spore coat polysaccharide biosynthesis protein SpsF
MYNGIITVRSSSSRLKKKCFLKINDLMIIEHVILRCLHGNITPIICTSRNKEDNVLVEIAKKYEINFFQGSLVNKIKRWHDCIKSKKIKYFHTIDADDPYFDYYAVRESLDLLKKQKLDLVKPSKASRYGGASEGYSFSHKGIAKLYNSLKQFKLKSKLESLNTEMIDGYLDNSNLKYKIYRGKGYQIKKNIRLTLDYKEDFKLFKILFEKFGSFTNREVVNNFLKKNKHILKINYFRNNSWDKKQKNFKMPKLK